MLEENTTAQTTESVVEKENTYGPVYRWTITPKGNKTAHVGDSVIHPDGSVGKIVSGQSNVSFGKRQAACVGDKVQCPGHDGVILQGAKSISIGGKSLAREGDKTSCGGVIMSGFPTITALDRSRTVHGKSDETNQEIRFTLLQSVDSEQGSYVGMPFTFKLDGGETGKGVIDESGELCFEVKPETKEAEITLPNGQSFIIGIIERYEPNTERDSVTSEGFRLEDNKQQSLEQAKAYQTLINTKE